MTPTNLYSCITCGWSGNDLLWAAVSDSFGRHAGECPACARRFRGCYLSAPSLRQRGLAQREARATRGHAPAAGPPELSAAEDRKGASAEPRA